MENKKLKVIHLDATIEKNDGSFFEEDAVDRIMDAIIDAVEKENTGTGCGMHEYGENRMCQCCEEVTVCNNCLKEITCTYCAK